REAGTLEIPIRLLVIAAAANHLIRLFLEQRPDVCRNPHGSRRTKLYFAPALAHLDIVHLEIHQVAFAVGDIIAAVADAVRPIAIVELRTLAHVTAAQADALAIDA